MHIAPGFWVKCLLRVARGGVVVCPRHFLRLPACKREIRKLLFQEPGRDRLLVDVFQRRGPVFRRLFFVVLPERFPNELHVLQRVVQRLREGTFAAAALVGDWRVLRLQVHEAVQPLVLACRAHRGLVAAVFWALELLQVVSEVLKEFGRTYDFGRRLASQLLAAQFSRHIRSRLSLVRVLDWNAGALLQGHLAIDRAEADAFLLLDQELVVNLVVERIKQSTRCRRQAAFVSGAPLLFAGRQLRCGKVLKS